MRRDRHGTFTTRPRSSRNSNVSRKLCKIKKPRHEFEPSTSGVQMGSVTTTPQGHVNSCSFNTRVVLCANETKLKIRVCLYRNTKRKKISSEFFVFNTRGHFLDPKILQQFFVFVISRDRKVISQRSWYHWKAGNASYNFHI